MTTSRASTSAATSTTTAGSTSARRGSSRSPTLVAQGGSYTNTGTVTGTEPRTQQTVTASDIARSFGRTGAEGLTPGFWKTNVDTKNAVAWPRLADGTLVLDPLQPVSSLFAGFPPVYASLTLDQGLGSGGGGIEALLRHAIAAVLNATHPWVAYPLSAGEIVALVNAAIASGNPTTIESLKNQLQGYNERGSDLDANGRVPSPTLSVLDVSITEGNAGNSIVLVTIALSGPALGPVSVAWATANGSATAGSDYVAASRHCDLRGGRERQDGRDHDRRRHEQRGQRDVHCPAHQCGRRRRRPLVGDGHDRERRRAAEHHSRRDGRFRCGDGREHDHVHCHAFRQLCGRAHAEPSVERRGDVRRRLHGDAVGRHARCERLDADAGRRPDLGDADGERHRRRNRRGGRDGRAHRPRGGRLHRRLACGRHGLDRRQRPAATDDRRSDRH